MNRESGLILTFTDFGSPGPYLGQMEAAVRREAPSASVIHLQSDAPACNPKFSAYLLAALANQFDAAVFVCVVDPGVGGVRRPLLIESRGQWFVGPDNGLFAPLLRQRQAEECRIYHVLQHPSGAAKTFHGRDLFASVAAKVHKKQYIKTQITSKLEVGTGWQSDLYEFIYADHYGNLFSGVRGSCIDNGARLVVGERQIAWAPQFDAVAPGEPFWYVNSCGLVEVAVNGGRADRLFSNLSKHIIKII
jgi:S-adenosyl-L-methionine hydrolase (adenosine-forming)